MMSYLRTLTRFVTWRTSLLASMGAGVTYHALQGADFGDWLLIILRIWVAINAGT